MKDPLQNFDNRSPLVSAIVVAHEGDARFLPRSLGSVAKQDIPPEQLEVILAFDGTIKGTSEDYVQEASALLKEAGLPLWVMEWKESSGYYTLPRNRATPLSNGLYVANLDADNEWRPGHLSGLLTAIRTPRPPRGWADFVYSRREYVIDKEPTAEWYVEEDGKFYWPTPEGGKGSRVAVGPSDFFEWNAQNVANLIQSPNHNFIDTSDFLIGKSALYKMSVATGCIWNQEHRRVADWEFVVRAQATGLRGHGVDQVTNIYHWRGTNVSILRKEKLKAVPIDLYERFRAEGKIIG